MELVKKVYDIERKIKLGEAKFQLFFWGGVAVVLILLLLIKYYLEIEFGYIFLIGFALANIYSMLFFHSKLMNKEFEQIQRLKKERDLLERLINEERIAFSGEITLITNEVIKSDFFIEHEKEVFDKNANIGYLKDKIVSLKRYNRYNGLKKQKTM